MDDGAPPQLPTFAPHEKVCGNCRLWSPHSVDGRGWVGPCRLQPNRGLFPPQAPICDAFVGKGQPVPSGGATEQTSRRARSVAPTIKRIGVPAAAPNLELGELTDMTRDELMQVFLEAAGASEVSLAPKWEGGVLKLIPGKTDALPKEVPLDAFFHKIVMLRDRLRTLEQKVNAHPKLSDAEKVDLQQYITRCYGSLTTFNALFQHREDQFVGQKGEE